MLSAQQNCAGDANCTGVLLNAGGSWHFCAAQPSGGSGWVALLPPATCVSGSGEGRSGYSIEFPDAVNVSGLGTVSCAPSSQAWVGFATPTVSCPPYPVGGENTFLFEGCTENVCQANSGVVPNAVAGNAVVTGANNAGPAAYVVAGIEGATTTSELGVVTCSAQYDGSPQLSCQSQPVDCIGSWGDWDSCSATACGADSQNRTYTVSTLGSVSDAGYVACAASDGATQSQPCGSTLCPTDCEGSWGAWGGCYAPGETTEACGTGTGARSRTYAITVAKQGNGATCPVDNNAVDEQACDFTPCDPFCYDYAVNLAGTPPVMHYTTFGKPNVIPNCDQTDGVSPPDVATLPNAHSLPSSLYQTARFN
jgi:hypothetical protein